MTTTALLQHTATTRRVPTSIKQAGRLAVVYDPNSWRKWPPCVFGLEIEGAFDAALLERSLTCVARRHTALRTHFPDFGALDHGYCLAPDEVEWPLRLVDLRGLAQHEREAAEQEATAQLQDYFDPAAPPLFRAHLLRHDDERWLLGVAVDHLLFDGSSIPVFLDDLAHVHGELLRGRSESELVHDVSDFAAFCALEREWLAGPVADRALRHWRPIWDGVGPFPPAGLPTRPDAPDRRPEGAIWSRRLPADQVHAARSGLACGYVSPFAQAASAVLFALGEVTGRDDRALLYTSSRRFTAQSAETIGDMTDKTLLRIQAPASTGLAELTARVRDFALDAADHATVPFEFVRDALVPDPADQRPAGPFIMLNVDALPPAPRFDGLTARLACPVSADAFSEFGWLAVELESTDPQWMTLNCGYQSSLFDDRTVDALMTRVAASLTRQAL